MEAAVTPLPRDETTPPVQKIYFVILCSFLTKNKVSKPALGDKMLWDQKCVAAWGDYIDFGGIVYRLPPLPRGEGDLTCLVSIDIINFLQ
jgi:hypothetical protein